MLFVRLATLNTRGLNERKKQLAIVELLKEKKSKYCYTPGNEFKPKKRKEFRKNMGGHYLHI